MAQSNMTEGTTYILIGFVVLLTIFLISSMATVISNSDHSELTTASEDKMESLSLKPSDLGFDTNYTGGQKTDMYGFNVSVGNDSMGGALDSIGVDSKNEFSLDFTFGKKKANAISRFIYAVLSFPKFLTVGLFGLSYEGIVKNIVDLTVWLWRIFIFVAIIYFVRNK